MLSGPNPPLWKASVPSTKSEAHDIVAAFELGTSPQAVLINEEPFNRAVVEALYTACPMATCSANSRGATVHVALLPDIDWIKLTQEGLPPVRAGRFFVYGAHDAGTVPPGVIPIRIEAGLAFGTGHHETTALCLRVLSDLQETPLRQCARSGMRHGSARDRRGEVVAQAACWHPISIPSRSR